MKTPRTAPAPKRWLIYVLAIIITAAVVLRLSSAWSGPRRVTLAIGSARVAAELALTPAAQFRGLSGRTSLPADGGMLFVFPAHDRYAFVMRDMLFPLDIIWIQDGHIVDIAPNLPPEAGRAEKDLTTYLPRAPANEVLEVPAGFSQKYSLTLGQAVVKTTR